MPFASSLSKAKDDSRKLLVVLLQSTSSTSGRKASDALRPLVFKGKRKRLTALDEGVRWGGAAAHGT